MQKNEAGSLLIIFFKFSFYFEGKKKPLIFAVKEKFYLRLINIHIKLDAKTENIDKSEMHLPIRTEKG